MQIPSRDQEASYFGWTGGPTHSVQKQHVPGYCGHVSGMKAENLYGEPYAKLTAKTLNEKIDRGFIIDDKERLRTTAGINFAHPKGEYATSNTLKLNAANILSNTQTSFP